MFPIRSAVATRYPPVATWGLIAANCIVFLIQIGIPPDNLEDFLSHFALIPAAITGPGDHTLADYLPLFTNMFLHGGWLHLILNMWTLWLFGPAVEDRLGHGRYLVFYFVAGIAASVTHTAFNAGSEAPALGASGAIAGVLGAYMRMFPFARVIVMIPIIIIPFFFELPAMAFVGLWFLMQVLQGTVELLGPSAGGGVAWWAHVGGFVAGVLLAPVVRQPRSAYRAFFADEGVMGFTPSGTR